MKKSFLLVLFVILTAVLLVTGAAFAEDGDELPVNNGLPVVYLNIDESEGHTTIEEMLNSPGHIDTCDGKISIKVPEGFHYSDFPEVDLESVEGLDMTIRGRGNSTWARADKKPFKIKLDKKADLFSLGKNKHWVLIANALDPSLLKDRISAWLGDELDFGFTPRGVPVDMVMTGEKYGTHYIGSYYFSENVRVDDNRLEIQELEETDTEMPKITGGYLIQNSAQVRIGSPDKFVTDHGVGWATHTPSFDPEDQVTQDAPLGAGEEDTESEEAFAERDPDPEEHYQNLLGSDERHPQQVYIQNYIQQFEDILFEGGAKYRDLMDVESAAKYWLMNTISLNLDAYITGSTYLYKDRDPEGGGVSKLYWGPLWDFDFAWYYDSIYTGFRIPHEWLKPLFCDKSEGGFVEELHKQWPVMKAALTRLSEDGGVMDKYYEETKDSAKQDHILWNPEEDPAEFDYKAITEKFKTWIKNRISWVDENIDSLDSLVHKVEYYNDEELFLSTFVQDGHLIEGSEEYPEKEGYVFLGWVDQNGNTIDPFTEVYEDLVLKANYVSEKDAIMAQEVVFKANGDMARYLPFAHAYQIEYDILPTDAQERSITWTSSDETLATVDQEGVVLFTQPGEEDYEVTITATLKSGKTKDFTLKVTGGDFIDPDTISPEREYIAMAAGAQDHFTITTDPSPAKILNFEYTSDNEDVVTVDDMGILTAVAPGTATVSVKAISPEKELTTSTTVYVTDLPIVYVDIDESEGHHTIEEMNASEDHSVLCDGTVKIVVPEGFRYSDMPDDLELESTKDLVMTIRGRGNSTWCESKKPSKIKLDKKTDIFGLGKNKHWVLIANAYDDTLLRDRITAWIGEKLGFEFTPTGYPVDLVMNGKYLGSYYFSENVRVDENRLEIDELDETITDPDSIEITGGYLIQNSLQTRPGSPDIFHTKMGVDWATHTPTFDLLDDGYENPAQQQYIQNHIQKMEDAMFGENFTNSEGMHYRDLMDIDSAVKYWLVNTLSQNGDAYSTGSTYIYKKRDTADGIGKVYWGPLWDFDYAWDYGPDTDYFDIRGEWSKALLYDTEEGGFIEGVNAQWPVLKAIVAELTEEGGIIDQFAQETKASAIMDRKVNHKKHGPLGDDEEYEEENVSQEEADFDYDAAITKMKSWIDQRTAWVDENLPELGNKIHKVSFYSGDEVFYSSFVEDGQWLKGLGIEPEKDGMVFIGWADENGEELDPDTHVFSDINVYAVYIPESEATHAEWISLRTPVDMVKYDPANNDYPIPFTVLPSDAQDRKVQWTSSDESIATVNKAGIVTIKAPGEVTFTGSLKYGSSVEFKLFITDGEIVYPERIYPESDTVYLFEGEMTTMTILTDPCPAKFGFTSYEVTDSGVISKDWDDVITAVAPGIARINAEMTNFDENWDVVSNLNTSVKVIVSINEATQNVNKLINELPDKVTLDDKEQIENARKAYDALDDYEKSTIPELQLAALDVAQARLDTAIAKAELEKEKAKKAEAEKKLKEAQAAQKKAELALKKAQAKNRTVTGLKLTSKNRKITVKYKKTSKASGYQIQYRLKGAKKYKYLKKFTTKLKFTSKKLKKGKTYQVRVRPYTKINGKKYYGKWTAAKKIKVKK
ncbi:MAG: CotH kinase family protein [Firmicutes bacterium]|nr:CotH kinase family protein [Bacillota bacterium]